MDGSCMSVFWWAYTLGGGGGGVVLFQEYQGNLTIRI